MAMNVFLLIPQARLTASVVNIVSWNGLVGAYYAAGVVNGVNNDSLPPTTSHGAAISIFCKIREKLKE